MNDKAFIVIIDEDNNEEKIPIIDRAKIEEFKNLLEVYNNDH